MAVFLVFLLAVMIAGCSPKLISNVTPMVGADGKSIRVMAATTRDRTGTELQGQVWQDEDGKVLAAFQGAGPGIVNNAMYGAVTGLEQAGGLIGAGALLRPSHTNVSNNNDNSGSGSGNVLSATGGAGVANANAKAKASQIQGQGQTQGQLQGQSQRLKNTFVPTNVNANTFVPTNVNANTFAPKQSQSQSLF